MKCGARELIQSATNVRNCIRHHQGYVTERYCNDEGRLSLLWPYWEIKRFSPKHELIEASKIKVTLQELGEYAVAKSSLERKTFEIGDKINLSDEEIAFAANSFFSVTNRLSEQLTEAVRKSGLQDLPVRLGGA